MTVDEVVEAVGNRLKDGLVDRSWPASDDDRRLTPFTARAWVGPFSSALSSSLPETSSAPWPYPQRSVVWECWARSLVSVPSSTSPCKWRPKPVGPCNGEIRRRHGMGERSRGGEHEASSAWA